MAPQVPAAVERAFLLIGGVYFVNVVNFMDGLDLMTVLIGSEGMLAVTLEVSVKLVPKPQLARCIMASFDDIRKAGDAVASVIAAGIIPAGPPPTTQQPVRCIPCQRGSPLRGVSSTALPRGGR